MSMKILLLSWYLPNHQQLISITNKNKISYCKYWNKKGHDYTFFNWLGRFGEFHTSIAKIPLISYLLKTTDYDLIYFQDCDSVIMNYAIPLESLIDDEHSFFITSDALCFNGGQFLVKNNVAGRKLFDFFVDQMKHHSYGQEQILMQTCYEQFGECRSIIKVCPQRAFNAYYEETSIRLFGAKTPGDFQKGDFLVHWVGCSLENRIELALSDRVKNNTVYPKDYHQVMQKQNSHNYLTKFI
jgi:hypothetical protein